MLLNYFKLALRSIARKKLYSAINLTGLSCASAFCILVYWYMQYEKSFDRFHGGHLYRVEFSSLDGEPEPKPATGLFAFLKKQEETHRGIQTPVVLAPELKRNLPDIDQAVRIMPGYGLVLRANNQSFKEENNSAYTDKNFFSVFNFPLVRGNAATVLSQLNQIVISETAARKYFGKADPIGKTITVQGMNNAVYQVSGIAKDFPANSSFRFDFVMLRESVPDYADDLAKGLNTFSDLLIVKLKAGVDPVAFEKKFDDYIRSYFKPTLKEWAAFPGSHLKPENFHAYIRPYAEAHYVSGNHGWGHFTDQVNIAQLGGLAIIILLIACLNYVLLTLTGTISRSSEVGIRKTVGAPRKQIILQFYIETQTLAFFAAFLGLIIAVACLPLFNNLIGSDMRVAYFSFKDIFLMLLALSLLLGIIAGIYPALVMSGLKPLNMMRKFSAYRLNPFLARVLTITQFSVCIILIISSLVIGRQMKFMNATDLGFNKDQILVLDNPFLFDHDRNKSGQIRERLRQFCAEEPSIEGMTSNGVPFEGYNNTNNHLIRGEKTMVEAVDVDYNYFSLFGIPIIKGRSFSPVIQSDSAQINPTGDQLIPGSSAARQAIVVNETLYNLLGRPALNEFNREMGGPILGVCKDYHSEDLSKKLSPLYHRIHGRFIGKFAFKIKAGNNIPAVIEKIRAGWNGITAGSPFSFDFLDQNVQRSYEAYKKWMQTITAACILAVIISSLGLFGLSGLTTLSRIKEIGIRKILGASSANLFLTLNKSTIVMAIISFVVAVPIASWLMQEWLEHFAYHIQAGWTIYAWAGFISLLAALIAVSYHAIRTANMNPVESLRTE